MLLGIFCLQSILGSEGGSVLHLTQCLDTKGKVRFGPNLWFRYITSNIIVNTKATKERLHVILPHGNIVGAIELVEIASEAVPLIVPDRLDP